MAKKQISEAELSKKLVKQVKLFNESLRRLERAKVERFSNFYNDAVKAARNKNNAWYFGYTKKGELKYTTNIKKLSLEQKIRLSVMLDKYQESYSTLTVKGTRQAMKKWRKNFEDHFKDKDFKNLSDEQIGDIFKILRNNGFFNSYDSDAIVDNLDKLAERSAEQIVKAIENIKKANNEALYGKIPDEKAIDELIGTTENFIKK